jgi:hypothetical protein
MFFPDPLSGEVTSEFIEIYEEMFDSNYKPYTSFAADAVIAGSYAV